MKFTKRAYVKVWQNCPEDEREDTTITLYDYEDANELKAETQPTFDLAEFNQ